MLFLSSSCLCLFGQSTKVKEYYEGIGLVDTTNDKLIDFTELLPNPSYASYAEIDSFVYTVSYVHSRIDDDWNYRTVPIHISMFEITLNGFKRLKYLKILRYNNIYLKVTDKGYVLSYSNYTTQIYLEQKYSLKEIDSLEILYQKFIDKVKLLEN